MELLQEEPLLLQIYDVISDSWILDLIKTAKPSLRRPPTVGNIGTKKKFTSNPVLNFLSFPNKVAGATPRTAAYAWLRDEHIPNTPISRRIELITDLNVRGMSASDALQIASYSFGGHVSTHFDSVRVPLSIILFQLNNFPHSVSCYKSK